MPPFATPPGNRQEQDSDLLRAFAVDGDEAAFQRLVERYAGLVYGIAFRRLRDAHLAQDTASEVFALLARKASRLSRSGCLAAWLQRTTVLVSANAARRESRRRSAMNAYSLSRESVAPAPSDPAWLNARECLDESLARLPERDRQLILARYFSGMTNEEIALIEGLREEAVKKRGQRALEKLRNLLMRRGVSISTPVLACGLAGHVRAGVGHEFAREISVAALKAAASPAGILSTAHHSLAYMIYGKSLNTAGLALFLCVLSGAGSFLAARSAASALDASLAEDAPELTAHTDAGPESESPAVGPGQILREAVNLLRRSRKESSPEMDRAILLFAGLSAAETAEAARAAEAFRRERPLADALATALAAAWAEKEPAAALAWLEEFPAPPKYPTDCGAHKIVLSWFGRDGRAAWEWWERRGQSNPPPLAPWGGFIGRGAGIWARTDPEAATAAVGRAETGARRIIPEFAGEISQGGIRVDSPAVAAAAKWANAGNRAELALCLAARHDPFGQGRGTVEGLFPVLNLLCENDPGGLEAAVAPLIRIWSSDAPKDAVTWVLDEAAASPVNTRELLQPALNAWGRNSPQEAWRWIQDRIAGQPGQADRLYDALLTTEVDTRVAGSRWPSSFWAAEISDSPANRDDFARFWARQRLASESGAGLRADEVIAKWRAELPAASEMKRGAPSIDLARRALQFAEELAASPASISRSSTSASP